MSRLTKTKFSLSNSFKKNINFKKDPSGLKNPVLESSSIWNIVSSQIKVLLGPEIHNQWFKKVRPLVISDNILILKTPDHNSTIWINQNYQELVDLLLSFQNKDINSFFISSKDIFVEGSLKV